MSVHSRLFRTAIVATCVVAAQPAAYAVDGWYFNPQGDGADGAGFVSALNVGGFGFIEQSLSTTQSFAMDFVEHGAYQVRDAASGGPFGAHDITVSYDVGGYVGLFGSDFTNGTIDIYADPVFDFGSTNGTFGADNGARIAQFEALLATRPEIRILRPPPGPRTPVLSFVHRDLDPAEVGSVLAAANVHVRTGFHCAPWVHRHLGTEAAGTVRVSAGPMLTADDIAAAAAAVVS